MPKRVDLPYRESPGLVTDVASACQERDYRGCYWGSCGPMDWDYVVEFRGVAMMVGEAKHRGGRLKDGPRVCYERWVDDGGAMAKLVGVIDHDAEPGERIPFATAQVRLYYATDTGGAWREPPEVGMGWKVFQDWWLRKQQRDGVFGARRVI